MRRSKFNDLMERSLPPLPRLAEMRTGKQPSLGIVSLINIILYFDIVLDVCAGGDGRHISRRELLQLFGLKRVGARLSSDGLCPFRPHSPNRDLPQYGGVMPTHHTQSIRLRRISLLSDCGRCLVAVDARSLVVQRHRCRSTALGIAPPQMLLNRSHTQ